MNELILQYLPFLIPLLVVQLGLMTVALIHILRHKKYRVGNRALWIAVVVLLNVVGPVLYFAIGRGDE
ncbi:MAG: PLD nuclease N-terminal domain-containing protein [Oscillospiraceae bacterium]|nr:PLD nuclease N-terminal domain-containing protein [Oscillospiraceae bacterium]